MYCKEGQEVDSYCLQEESQGNKDRVTIIIVNGIKSLKQNSVIIDRDYWLKVRATSSQTPKAFHTNFALLF